MNARRAVTLMVFALVSLPCTVAAQANIPAVAWSRPIGLPLENPGKEKPEIPYPHFDDGYWQGLPVGGFGAGTFSRSYRGDFVRWHLKAGIHKYHSVAANQFSVFQKAENGEPIAQALYAGAPDGKALSAWKWNYPVGAGTYSALYPKAWFDYSWDRFPVRLVLEQFSPVLPNNYRESSYPVAIYRWHATNPSSTRVTVGVMFSWTNMVGWLRDSSIDFAGQNNIGNINRIRSETVEIDGRKTPLKGLVFDRARRAPVSEEWDGQFAIAALEVPGASVSYVSTFDPSGDGAAVWKPFAESGRLPNDAMTWSSSGEPLAGAIAVTLTIEPGQRVTIPMALGWDLPVVQFGQGRKWNRRYTDFFGADGTNAWSIARAGLAQAQSWSTAIDRWHQEYIADESKPAWYRGMLFNELYALADIGTVWGRPVGASRNSPLTFSYLECFDYPFYETLDVRFYGSVPLAKFWPEIEKQVMRAFAATVDLDLTEPSIWGWKTEQEKRPQLRTRKARGAVPHDLGHPGEDPFLYVNQFNWQNTNGWKDLNSKFVLLVYRAFVLSGSTDIAFLRDSWKAIEQALEYLRQFDRNGDGLPEGEGFPDQTYDVWVVRGESAYAGGLYLAALRAAETIAGRLGHADRARAYRQLFERAQASFIDKLWTGEYFRYDTGSDYKDNVMADQLAGQWYAHLTGLGDIVPKHMRQSALKKIFQLNVLGLADGSMGALNGITPDGKILHTNEQIHEVWTGTTFALSSLMLAEGLRDEGFRTARGIYHVVYERLGYWFRTPEAWDERGLFRASMYMRPGAIWAMEIVPAVAPTR